MRSVMLAAALAMAAGSAGAQDYLLVRGQVTCDIWAKHRTSMTAASLESFFVGLLDGITAASRQNVWLVPHEINAEQAYFWMDRYCADNPLSQVTYGAFQLIRERLGDGWNQK